VDKEQETIQRHITHTPHATQGKLQSRQPQKQKTAARRRTPPQPPATGNGVNDKFATGVNRRSGVIRNPCGVRPNNWSSEFDV